MNLPVAPGVIPVTLSRGRSARQSRTPSLLLAAVPARSTSSCLFSSFVVNPQLMTQCRKGDSNRMLSTMSGIFLAQAAQFMV